MTNVILVFTDDLPPDVEVAIPFTVGLCDIVVPKARHNTPLCGPARAALHTGRFPRSLGLANNVNTTLEPNAGIGQDVMIAAALKRAQVTTGFVGKYINGFPWGQGNTWVPRHWDAFHVASSDQIAPSWFDNGVASGSVADEHRVDGETLRAVDFVETAREPFCLVWASNAPHQTGGPNVPDFTPAVRHAATPFTLVRRPNFNEADISDKPAWLASKWPTVRDPTVDGSGTNFSVETLDGFHADVLRLMLALDEGVSDVWDALVARGIEDDTVIIWCGDNANLFGEHRHWSKGCVWDEAVNMHLRAKVPGVAAATSDALVSTIDLAPTLCDYFGARMPVAPHGMSFRPVLDGAITSANYRQAILHQRDEEDPIQFGPGTYTGVTTSGNAKWVEYLDGSEEFYDLAADPYELASDHANGSRGLDRVLADLAAETGGT